MSLEGCRENSFRYKSGHFSPFTAGINLIPFKKRIAPQSELKAGGTSSVWDKVERRITGCIASNYITVRLKFSFLKSIKSIFMKVGASWRGMPSRVMQQKRNVKKILRRRKEIVVKFCRNWFSRRKATLKIRRKKSKKKSEKIANYLVGHRDWIIIKRSRYKYRELSSSLFLYSSRYILYTNLYTEIT